MYFLEGIYAAILYIPNFVHLAEGALADFGQLHERAVASWDIMTVNQLLHFINIISTS